MPSHTDTPGPARRLPGAARKTAVVAWSALIFLGSSVPGSKIPGRFGPLGHFGEYAVLSALTFLAAERHPTRRRILIALAYPAVFAVTDEFHQAFVPMRTPDPVDWLVDVIGATVGLIVLIALTRLRRKEEPQ